MEDYPERPYSSKRHVTTGFILLLVTVIAGASVIWFILTPTTSSGVQIAAGLTFTLSLAALVRILMDPDYSAARQSDDLLTLTRQTLDSMKEGLTTEAAQHICELLLPATHAIAVAITDREHILGYAGYNASGNRPGDEIRTSATSEMLKDGKPRVLTSYDDIGLTAASARINAAIIQPLVVGNRIAGSLKFYYRSARQITETEKSLAQGFAELLSTQMAAVALEEQSKLATSMELKALQAQINPHFLFNTINTIASLIRTDPNKARELLREFAVFYRSTLEDSNDLIPLEREIKQVERYFSFEIARFGEERLKLDIDIDPEVSGLLVPSFMIQPLVENSVHHAMKSEGVLHIRITGTVKDGMIVISITDDGAGMSEEKLRNMMNPESSQGLGIAVRNVRDRMRGYFGQDSRMDVSSELGKGTTVTFTLERNDTGQYLQSTMPAE